MNIIFRIILYTSILLIVFSCLKTKRSLFDFSSPAGIGTFFVFSNVPSNQPTNSNTTTETVSSPSFTPQAGTYNSIIDIEIKTTTADAVIYYTLDGTDPTLASNKYTSPISIRTIAGLTLKAIGIKSNFSNSSVTAGIFSLLPLKTGQTTSFSSGDDGNKNLGTLRSFSGPTPHSVYTSDFTTTDNITGLVWKTCAEGSTGSNCGGGSLQSNTWSSAPSYCTSLNSNNSNNGFAGRTNWRITSKQELESIIHYGASNEAIYATNFPTNGQLLGPIWASEEYDISTAWIIDESNGYSFNLAKGNSAVFIRCVSGTAYKYSAILSDNNNGTIQDKRTGLIWQKCSRGQDPANSCSGGITSDTWTNALSYCNSLTLASKSWRLPNINELKTISNFEATAPKIDSSFFPSTASSQYWSSTTYFPGTSSALVLDFGTGGIIYSPKSNSFAIRCVSGQ